MAKVYRAIPRKNPEKAIDALTENAEILTGTRGSGLDRAVTYRDLKNVGLVEFGQNGFGKIHSIRVPDLSDYVDDELVADPPTLPLNVQTFSGFTGILLTWDRPSYEGHSHTEIWRYSADNLGFADLIATTTGFSYPDTVGTDKTYYYWVRFVNIKHEIGGFHNTNGVIGQTEESVSFLLGLLSAEINESALALNLRSRIDLIDAQDTGLVDVYNVLNGLVGGHGTKITDLEINTGEHATRLSVLESSTQPLLGDWSGTQAIPPSTDINTGHNFIISSSENVDGSIRVYLTDSLDGFSIGFNGTVIYDNYIGVSNEPTWYTFDVTNILVGNNTITIWSEDLDMPVVTKVELRSGASSFESRIEDIETVSDQNAIRLGSLGTWNGTSYSKITNLETTTSQSANSITQLNTTVLGVDGLTDKVAALEVSAQTSVDDMNDVKAEWTLKLDANGVLTGVGLVADEGSNTSAMYVYADTFAILPTGSTDPADAGILPFIIQDNVTYINDANIISLKAEKIKGGDLITDSLAVTIGGVNLPPNSLDESALRDEFLNTLVRIDPSAVATGGSRSINISPVATGNYYVAKENVSELLSGGASTQLSLSIIGGTREANAQSSSLGLTKPTINFKVYRKKLPFGGNEELINRNFEGTLVHDIQDHSGNIVHRYFTVLDYSTTETIALPESGEEYEYWIDVETVTGSWGSSNRITFSIIEVTGSSGGVLVEWNGIQNKEYVDATTNGIVPKGGIGTTKFLRQDGTWQEPPDTTYVVGDGGLTENNFTNTLKSKLDGIPSDANNYIHPPNVTTNLNTSGAEIIDYITTNGTGHITAMGKRSLSPSDIGASSSSHDHDATYLNKSGGTLSGDINLNGNVLITSNIGATNVDHIWHDDGTNTWHFVSDNSRKSQGNSTLKAGYFTGIDVTISSDIKLKDKLEPIENASDKCAQIRTVTYDLIYNNNDRHAGLIANDVEKVFPVGVRKVADENIGEKLTLSTPAMVALNMAATNEHTEEIKALKADVAELKRLVGTMYNGYS